MKQVIQNARDGNLRVVEVPEPMVQPGCALVRTAVSVISAGTERSTVDFAQKSLLAKARARPDLVRKTIDKARRDGIAATIRAVRARLDEPLPLGYSASGVVEAVGAGIEGRLRVGQRVAIAGAGVANHAELNVVPENLLAPVPDNVSDEASAFGTLGAIALHGVRNLEAELGDIVGVIGVGLVGLLATRLLALSGCRTVAIDMNAARLASARHMGAELTLDLNEGNVTNAVLALTANRGVDRILVTAADESNATLELAAEIARDRARISIVGKVGTAFPFGDFMKKEITLVVSRSYGPGRYDDDYEKRGIKYPAGYVRWTETENLSEILRLLSRPAGLGLDVAPLITHRFDIARADKAYDLVVEGAEPHLGVVLTYPPRHAQKTIKPPAPPPATSRTAQCNLAVLGAGVHARTILIPALSKIPNVTLGCVATRRGATADLIREKFGFAQATTSIESALADASVDAVVIATPHAFHAELTAAALEAGKPVFVEKPLALDRAGLARVIDARRRSSSFFMVGFNRRFAPMALKARKHVTKIPGPKMVVMRINSAPSPIQTDSGSRLLTELCHFVDFARFLLNSPIRSVTAAAMPHSTLPGGDDASVTLICADGSLATIAYTGLGSAADVKERIEIFGAGTIARIEDFRRLAIVADGRTSERRDRLDQDKGHHGALAAFVAAVRTGQPPIDENEMIETSLATIAVMESLRTGARVDLPA